MTRFPDEGAKDLLQQCGWDVALAADKHVQQAEGHNKTEMGETAVEAAQDEINPQEANAGEQKQHLKPHQEWRSCQAKRCDPRPQAEYACLARQQDAEGEPSNKLYVQGIPEKCSNDGVK